MLGAEFKIGMKLYAMNPADIRWHEVDTVLLDLDGTLLDLHFDNYFWLHHLPRRWAEISGQTEEACRQQLHLSYDQMQGTLDWYCLDYWTDRLQLDILELKHEVAYKVALRPEAEQFLQRLRQLQKKVLLVTNGHRGGLQLKLAATGIDIHFDEIVSSHDYRAPKETPDFWTALMREHPFDRQRALFVDDNESVLDSAATFGIRYLLQILQPDMQRPGREPGYHAGIHHFSELALP